MNNSSFRNGKQHPHWRCRFNYCAKFGVENSTFQNTCNSRSDGVIYIAQSPGKRYLRSPNDSKKFHTSLPWQILLFKLFLGGLVMVLRKKLTAIIGDSIFLRNSAARFNSALYVQTNDMTEISLGNDYFLENRADDGGIVHVINRSKHSVFNPSVTNVMFVQNQLCAPSAQKKCA